MKVLKTIGIWFALNMAIFVICSSLSPLFGNFENFPSFLSFLFAVIFFAGPIIGTVYINRRLERQRDEEDNEDEEERERLFTSYKESLLPSLKNEHLIEFEVAGLTYRPPEAMDRARKLFFGEKVCLVKEPDNLHDERAIKIMTDDDIHIGYVPRFLCTEVSNLMDGDTGIAYVDYINYGRLCPFVHLYI